MDSVNKVEDRLIYAFVAKIPPFYHSADLRNYFSQFVEQSGFDCFHFRHRPEIIRSHEETPSSSADGDKSAGNTQRGKSLCCVVRLRHNKFVELVKMYHRKCWLDRKGESIRSLCYISKIKLADAANG